MLDSIAIQRPQVFLDAFCQKGDVIANGSNLHTVTKVNNNFATVVPHKKVENPQRIDITYHQQTLDK